MGLLCRPLDIQSSAASPGFDAPALQPRGQVRVLLNALALHSPRDGARIFLENLLQQLPRVWPQAEIYAVAPHDAALPEAAIHAIRRRTPRSGVQRALRDFVDLPRIEARLSPGVVISPNESIPTRIHAPLVVVAQNLFYHCPGVGPL